MGGSWDATNVADGTVAVITPDQRRPLRKYLGDRPQDIALEKAGIIKPGAHRGQRRAGPRGRPGDRRPGRRRSGATVLWEGVDFGVEHQVPAVGGQMSRLRGLRGEYDEVFLPVYGAHQAHNAALALAAVEAFAGDRAARRRPGPRGVRRGHVAGPARGRPAQPDDRARRRAQPARGRRHRGGAAGVVHVQPAGRGGGRHDGQGLRRPARRAASRCSRTSSAPRTPRRGRCRPRSSAEVATASSAWTGCTWSPGCDDAIDRAAGIAEPGGVYGEASAPAACW